MTGGISYSRDNLNLKLYIVPPRHTDFEHITLRPLKYLLKTWFDHKTLHIALDLHQQKKMCTLNFSLFDTFRMQNRRVLFSLSQ